MPRRRSTKKIAKKSTLTKEERKAMGKIVHKKVEIDGIIFDSKMESEFYLYLKVLKASGIVKEFTLQPEFLLQEKFIILEGKKILGSDKDFEKMRRKHKVPTVQAISYISDFAVTYMDGTYHIVDVKGRATADFKIKRKMFQYVYPTLSLQLVIFNDKTKTWEDYDAYMKAERKAKRERKAKKEAMSE